MTARRCQTLLWSVAVVTALIGAGVVLLAIGLPLDWIGPTSQHDTAKRSTADSTNTLPALETFDKVFALRLQQPLFEITPGIEEQTPSTPVLSLHLTGTIVERGHSAAIFQTSSANIELRNVGERIDGAEVLSVARESVRVKYGEQIVDLKVEQPPAVAASSDENSPIDASALVTAANLTEAPVSGAAMSDTTGSPPTVSTVHPPPAIGSDDAIYVLPLNSATTKPARD